MTGQTRIHLIASPVERGDWHIVTACDRHGRNDGFQDDGADLYRGTKRAPGRPGGFASYFFYATRLAAKVTCTRCRASVEFRFAQKAQHQKDQTP